ncbi:hypothetical protein O0L34_g10579 [Tuta absoluta]|nr:hypothetical protein O0L34_g10579 [Tuta absoluta]
MMTFFFTIFLIYSLAVDAMFVPKQTNKSSPDTNRKSPQDLDAAIADTIKVIDMLQNASDGSRTIPSRRSWFKWRRTTSTTPLPISKAGLSLCNTLIEVLQKVTNILQRLNKNVELQNNLNPLRVVPLNDIYEENRYSRRKRNAKDLDSEDEIKKENSDPSTTPGAITGSFVDSVSHMTEEESPVLADTTNADADSQTETTRRPARRMFGEIDPVAKHKLLTLLNYTFDNMPMNVQPAQKIKEAYSNNKMFRMGYLVASIDKFEAAIMNLRSEMESQMALREDNMLELFDKILSSNKVLTSLIQSLREVSRKYSRNTLKVYN